MAMEMTSTSAMSAELKQTYDRLLLMTATPNFVFMNYGERKRIPPRGGKSIEFRRFERIGSSSRTLTEGTPPTETQATISSVAATVSQYGAFSKISDMLELQSFDPIIEEYTKKYAENMAETLDVVTRDIIVAGTTVQYASTAATRTSLGSGMYINAAELVEAKRTLERANAKPIDGKYFTCIVHPDNVKDLYDDSDIVNAFQLAGPRDPKNPMFTGVLGDWMGIRFVQTTLTKVWSSMGLSGADVYGVMLIGKEAYGITELDSMQAKTVIHPRGSGGHTDPLEQYSTVGWKAAMAAVVLNQDFMVRIECISSYSNAA